MFAVVLGTAPATRVVGAQAGEPGWAHVAGVVPPTVHLESVFMMDAANAWVVGYEGIDGREGGRAYRLQLRDNRWTAIARYEFRSILHAVSAISDSNVWVVGERGLLSRFDGARWLEVPNPLPDSVLLTLQMFGEGEEGWAGGYQSPQTPSGGTPILLHYKD